MHPSVCRFVCPTSDVRLVPVARSSEGCRRRARREHELAIGEDRQLGNLLRVGTHSIDLCVHGALSVSWQST